MGYSFGGVTSRMLLYLLNNTFVNDSPGLFDKSVLLGNSFPGWVSSITTMSTPHNGATISNIVTDIFPFTDNLLPVANMISSSYYDFDLDHWGISQKKNESWPDYFMRLKNHTAWETKNNVGWDSNIQGAKELNDILTIDSSVYYFSYSTTASILDPVTGYHIPDKHLSWTNYPLCWFMGRNVVDMGDGQTTDSTWFENDGTVNTISMIRPFTGKNGPEPMKIFSNSEPVETGIWHFMGKYQQDHKNFIGFFLDDEKMVNAMMTRFENHVRILYSLP